MINLIKVEYKKGKEKAIIMVERVGINVTLKLFSTDLFKRTKQEFMLAVAFKDYTDELEGIEKMLVEKGYSFKSTEGRFEPPESDFNE
ncbi:hypothetical protein MHB40_20550 [Lysinibacillus sp. FSL K6-0057]|uniref:hypothetical protein n=1 Tax=Lysinibacillus sp. FSL K6-0057 TaxID=2921411 RepID=UPI00315AE05C